MTVRPHIPDLIADQIVIAHADTRATLAAVARRAEGASTEDLLLAAIALARDQAARIAELEAELDQVEEAREQLEGDLFRLDDLLTEAQQQVADLRAIATAKA